MQISVLNATIKIEIFCIYDRKGAKNTEGRKGLRTWYVLILFLLLYNSFFDSLQWKNMVWLMIT